MSTATEAKPKSAAYEDACRFLETLFAPGDRMLIRPIETWSDGDRKHDQVDYKNTEHFMFGLKTADDQWSHFTSRVRSTIQRHAERSEQTLASIYFGVCPRFGRENYDKAWQIRTVRCLWADIDDTNDIDEAAGRCADAELPRPSIFVNSGRGLHLYWLLSTPYVIDDVGDPPPVHIEWVERENGRNKKREYYSEPGSDERLYLDIMANVPDLSPKAQQLQDVLSGIAASVGGDHTFDLSRILRVPDTLNRKNQRNGQDPVRCRMMVLDSDARYDIAEFDHMLLKSPSKARREKLDTVELPEPRDFAKIDSRIRSKFADLVNKSRTAPQGERSGVDFSLLAFAIENRIAKSDVWEHASHVGRFAESGESYFERTWWKASLKVKERILDGTDAAGGKNGGKDDAISYLRYTAAELDAGDFRTEYQIDGALVAGQPCIVAGGKKTLKTNILLDAAISLASGNPWLGGIKITKPSRVAIMTGESGLATIQETCRRICRSKGFELRDVNGMIISPDLPRIDSEPHLDALESFCTGDEIEVLVLDPAYLMMPMSSDDAGSLFRVGEFLRRLNESCQRIGVTLMLCHHTRKNIADPFEPPELEHIAWAGFQEFARQWWLIGRRQRYEPGTGEHRLWLNVGGSAGHSSLWGLDIDEGAFDGLTPRSWSVSLVSAHDARQNAQQRTQSDRQTVREQKHQAAVSDAKEAILAALRSIHTHEGTKSQIRDRSGKNGAMFEEALAELLRSGEIEECEIVRSNKQTYAGYRRKFRDNDTP